MTLTLKNDLVSVKTNQHVKYLGQRSFSLKAIVWTLRHTHTGPTTLPRPLAKAVEEINTAKCRYTASQKNATSTFSRYNFDVHESIFITFGRNATKQSKDYVLSYISAKNTKIALCVSQL